MNQSNILLISAALLALCFVMLSVVLFVLTSHRKKNAMAIQRVEKHLSESLQLLEEAQYQQTAIQREEYLRSRGPMNHMQITKDNQYTWLNDPWPWEYCKNKEV